MKVRVLEDNRFVNEDKTVAFEFDRFDEIEVEIDGKGNFLYNDNGRIVNIGDSRYTAELKYKLPIDWWTTIPNLDIIKTPEKIKHHSKEEMIENFMGWFNNINDDIDTTYQYVFEAYGVKNGRREVTDFDSEFTTEGIKFQDFFDIYYFRVMPWLDRINTIGLSARTIIEQHYKKEDCKVVDMFPDAEFQSDSILLEADNILNGDRNEQYNDPNESFKVYAEILKATFGLELTPVEICKVQMAIKLGRLKYKYKRDSLVDLCGYSEILHRLESNNDNNN